MTKITQGEARRLRKRVAQLEEMIRDERRRWGASYPDGVNIGTFEMSSANAVYSAIYTASMLGHAVVCAPLSHNKFHVYALPHTEMPA